MSVAPEPTAWDASAARALELLRAGDDGGAWASIDAAAADRSVAVPGPAAGFREVGRALYWTHRALPEYVRLQHEQIRRYKAEPAYVGRLTGVLYDLAAFTWPGWGDDVREDDRSAGRDAALRCAALREDPAHAGVEFTITPGMARWVVGAHALAVGDLGAARSAFLRARERNLEAGEDDTLDRGYLALTDVLERPRERAAAEALDAVLDELARRDDDDAAFTRDQLVTARRVFAEETPA